jgi:hypothetical protein
MPSVRICRTELTPPFVLLFMPFRGSGLLTGTARGGAGREIASTAAGGLAVIEITFRMRFRWLRVEITEVTKGDESFVPLGATLAPADPAEEVQIVRAVGVRANQYGLSLHRCKELVGRGLAQNTRSQHPESFHCLRRSRGGFVIAVWMSLSSKHEDRLTIMHP